MATAADLMAAIVRVQQLATQLINEKSESDRAVVDAVRDLNEADLRLQRLIEVREQEGQ